MSATVRGRIAVVHADRGFGFIETFDARYVFFHASDVRDRPFAAVVVGDIVDVEIVAGRPGKGPRAGAVFTQGADHDRTRD